MATNISLPKKVKAKWLKALRSGEYKQTEDTMFNPGTCGFCCLGVLQHVTMNGEVEHDGDTYRAIPSKRFWDYIGAKEVPLSDSSPYAKYPDGIVHALTELNDNKAYSFKQIANVIEKVIEEH